MAKSKNQKLSYISISSSQVIPSISTSSLESLLLSPKRFSRNPTQFFFTTSRNPRLWFLFFLFLFALVGMLKLGFNLDPLIPFAPYPCSISESDQQPQTPVSVQSAAMATQEQEEDNKEEFWKQPDGLGYRPCLQLSKQYGQSSLDIIKDRRKYLMVVVSGGMNQQRNQIVDAVVIARILGAALVVPILQVNVIWGDESEFADIFDLKHFKSVLANDVRIVSSWYFQIFLDYDGSEI